MIVSILSFFIVFLLFIILLSSQRWTRIHRWLLIYSY
nr:MAG TPA: hypothetical protein [Caudoviricetes sp.]